jgi:hypothetical protein
MLCSTTRSSNYIASMIRLLMNIKQLCWELVGETEALWQDLPQRHFLEVIVTFLTNKYLVDFRLGRSRVAVIHIYVYRWRVDRHVNYARVTIVSVKKVEHQSL